MYWVIRKEERNPHILLDLYIIIKTRERFGYIVLLTVDTVDINNNTNNNINNSNNNNNNNNNILKAISIYKVGCKIHKSS